MSELLQFLRTKFVFAGTIVWILCFFIPNLSHAQNKFTGVWREGPDHKIWVNADWDGFESKWRELSDDGYRLVDIETWIAVGIRNYGGIFIRGKGKYKLWVGLSWSKFSEKWKELKEAGQRIQDIEIYIENGQKRFIGVWREGNYRQKLLVDAGWEL
ncbi:hypothetical protein GWN91_02450, partial [Candidatus Saccharibacteria bacterium]|nr:hypothetical protein [Candidatus Saccharibacteria bacterium]NIV71740.1 hypothetical protein [Calditrichia bacterium]NIW78709.1 hypothetical protein [Calditrichia bacterium]